MINELAARRGKAPLEEEARFFDYAGTVLASGFSKAELVAFRNQIRERPKEPAVSRPAQRQGLLRRFFGQLRA